MIKQVLIILFILTWQCNKLHSQDTLAINYEQYMIDYVNNIPSESTDIYSDPTSSERILWDSCLTSLLQGQFILSSNLADSLSYKLSLLIDTISNDSFYALYRQSNGPHWGLYMFNQYACRNNLILMSTHPKKDLNTGLQAAYCFQNTNAALLMIAGTNRCNSLDFSTCSGTTSICGNNEKYRLSDLAHNDRSIFQETTATLLQEITSPYFIQLHGFSKTDTDPYLILSNGTRDTPVYDPLVELARYLSIIDTTLNYKIGHIDTDWTRLLGFTNTNGRLINASTSPCSHHAVNSDGRFFHIEQEYHKMRKDSSGWDKMAHALRATFHGESCPSREPIANNTLWYVEDNKVGDGKSWSSAHGELSDIINLAKSGDSIFISQGNYLPSKLDTNSSFTLHTSINLFGGFPINGGAFAQRDHINNPVILDGDIGVPGYHEDDIKNILRIQFLEENCSIDGIFISQGDLPDGTSLKIETEYLPHEIILNNLILLRF